MNERYRVRISRGDLEVEVESHDAGYVDAKLKEYLDSPASKLAHDHKARPSGKRMSVQEFARKINPKTGPESVLTVAYFIEKHEGETKVQTKAIAGRVGAKGLRKQFKNVSDAIAGAKDRGWLMDGDAPRSVCLTDTGEAWVEERVKANETQG
jgi:hypothetical protein